MSDCQFLPLVSIIIPVYNGAKYMREAIDSALKQTYTSTEVIVVNDGSCDDGETDRIALSYGDKIRYISKENGGCASALNAGLACMRGAYFSWLSHDDVYHLEKIEHQIKTLSQLQNHNTIIYGGYELIDEKSRPLTIIRPDHKIPRSLLNVSLAPLSYGLLHGCSLLIPSKYFYEIGFFDTTLLSTQDYALWFKFLRVAPIFFDEHVLIKSRVHTEQGTYKITTHLYECNQFWSEFISTLTEDERVALDGSSHLFFLRMKMFLTEAGFTEAANLAQKNLDESLEATKVSVIMPMHNRVMWAMEAIESVQAQTHKNFELIVVDDGSESDLSELKKMCAKDDRIKFISMKKSGPAAARNRGIKEATGDYIAFIDSDDLFCSDKLEKQLKYMKEKQCFFSHTSYFQIDSEKNHLATIFSGRFSKQVFPRIIASCPIAMPTVMGKRSIFQKNLFPEYLSIGEDCCLWITIASLYSIDGIDIPLSKVRITPTTTAFSNVKMRMGLVNILYFVCNHDYFKTFDRQIKSLLLDTIAYVDNSRERSHKINLFARLEFGLKQTKHHFLKFCKRSIRKIFRMLPVNVQVQIKKFVFRWRAEGTGSI